MPRDVILVIGPEPPPYTGMEVATRALLDELDAADWAYERVDTADPQDALSGRGRWSLHNVREALGDVAAMARICLTSGKRVRAVYVPIAQEFPGLYRDLAFIVLAIVWRRPFIVHLHGGSLCEFYESQSTVVRKVLRTILGRAAVGIVLTESLRPALSCVVEPRRIVVVPNGIDLEPTLTRRARQENADVRILFLATLLPSKGTLVFLETFARIRTARTDVVATLAGTWPSPQIREMTLARAAELGIADLVTFPGGVYGSAKAAVFGDADIFCCPSHYPQEGQPLVVLEAMAAGLPVVATSWRGIADTVVDGETGFLVAVSDLESLTEKLATLVEDAVLRDRMGAEGRKRYELLYTKRAFGGRMLEALEPWSSRIERPDVSG